jgi:geranylgeranyl reductase family protein
LTFDVIVVGAGPAGSTAARILGEAGVSTLLLDKSAFPRDKPCGGGISTRVIQRFPYLKAALRSIPVNWVNKVYLESPAGFAVDYRSDVPLYLMIRRCEFDNLLFSLARKYVEFRAPALVRKVVLDTGGATVTAVVDGEPRDYECKLILGCDGANSIVARGSGLRSGSVQADYAIDMMEETPYEELSLPERDRMYVYYRIRSHYGYGYVFPKTSHINLGVGFKLDYYLSKLRGEHYAHHSSFVEGLASKQLIAGRSNRANFRAFPLPISGPLSRTSSDRVLLSGDAGGFVNALTAEGIYYAMVSGEHAARTAVAAVKANDFTSRMLSRYEQSWKHEIGVDLEKSVRFQKLLLSDSNRVDRVIKAAGRNPMLADLLARYATGSLPHAQFKRALIRRALPTYVRELVAQVSDLCFR